MMTKSFRIYIYTVSTVKPRSSLILLNSFFCFAANPFLRIREIVFFSLVIIFLCDGKTLNSNNNKGIYYKPLDRSQKNSN